MQSLALRTPFCSSKAEHPADNRETGERYPAEGPPLDGVVSLHIRLKPEKCRRNSDSSGHFKYPITKHQIIPNRQNSPPERILEFQ